MVKDVIDANKELIKKYPFLLPHNRWTDKVSDDYDFSYTELDAMPTGWRNAFGEKMCEELKAELDKVGFTEQYRIMQIKEKYGMLRWYDNGATEEMYAIIAKFEELSKRICIVCGAPATKVSTGWVSPYCDKCAPDDSIPIEDYYAEVNCNV